jgi:hypothetical protein
VGDECIVEAEKCGTLKKQGKRRTEKKKDTKRNTRAGKTKVLEKNNSRMIKKYQQTKTKTSNTDMPFATHRTTSCKCFFFFFLNFLIGWLDH